MQPKTWGGERSEPWGGIGGGGVREGGGGLGRGDIVSLTFTSIAETDTPAPMDCASNLAASPHSEGNTGGLHPPKLISLTANGGEKMVWVFPPEVGPCAITTLCSHFDNLLDNFFVTLF